MSELRRITEDGSPTLWSEEFGEAYHSRIGALTEAREKFLKPYIGIRSFEDSLPVGKGDPLRDLAPVKTSLRILDACFGLGYNSFVFIDHFLKKNSADRQASEDFRRIEVCAIEKDASLLPKLKWVLPHFPDLGECVDSLIQKKMFVDEYFSIHLHHVPLETLYLKPESFPERGFDLVLHDAFSPAKCPEQWSAELFREYVLRMNEGGLLITYASALPVAAGLIEAGFSVARTAPVGRKQGGLMARKDGLSLVEKELSDLYETTTARAPYRSAGLAVSDAQKWRAKILENWEFEKKKLVADGKLTIKKYRRAYPSTFR